MPLIKLHDVDNFVLVKDVNPRSVDVSVINSIKRLDEREELEPFIKAILSDTNETPHGPSEIVDIFTHKASVKSKSGLAAFILKGKSFPTVRPKHVSHQIYRLEKIRDLKYTFFAATGNILDEAKEQFVATSSRLSCDYLILDANDIGRVLIAYGVLCPRDGKHIKGVHCSCGYTPKTKTSNVLQQDALTSLNESHNLGQKSGVVILPTGSGKTRVAVNDIKRINPNLIVYSAHSHEILDIAEAEFLCEFPATEIFRPKRSFKSLDLKKVNIITIQLLVRNLSAFSNKSVEYFIVDEFHHAAAKSYRRSLDALDPSFLLGLTATPFRGDRQDVLSLCNDNVIVCHELRTGIECGVLSPYHYYGCFDDIDYSNIRHNAQRYDIKDLEKALIIPSRNRAIIDKWREKAPDKQTIAFCCSHKHAKRVAKSFNDQGIKSTSYLSFDSRDKRKRIVSKFRKGEIKVLCVVDIFNEGVDLPFVEALLFLRPTESKRIFFQQLGRGLRQYVGKKYCIVIDFIGNFKNSYRIVEFQGLDPFENEEEFVGSSVLRSPKELLHLPIGCKVEFDERVIDVFGNQTMNAAYATRHNIARILIYQYKKLERRLNRKPKKIDVDRTQLLDSSFYNLVFGSWVDFEKRIKKLS